MSIITRYVIIEMAKMFLVTLVAMTAVMVLIGVVQEAVRENLTPLTILKLIPFVLPNALCFAIPGTALFSACIVFGRMAASNEIVAIKSSGISPLVMVWPALIVAFLLSLVTVFLNDVAVSWGRKGVYRVVLHSVEKTIYAVLNAERAYDRGRISIEVSEVVGDDLIHPRVAYQDDDGGVARFVADRARVSVNADTNMLVFSAVNLRGSMGEDLSLKFPDGTVGVPLQDVAKKADKSNSPSNLPLREIHFQTLRQREVIAGQRRKLAMQAAIEMASGDWISLTHPRWNADLAQLNDEADRIHRLHTEPWRRWANGFSCLCFVLVGVPLAMLMRKADFWTTFGLCFIPILLAYYPLLMFGVEQAKSGAIPPVCVWLGNLVMVAVGLWLTKREVCH